jgi:hypothetical protein
MKAGRMDELAMHPTVKPTALVADAIRDCSRRKQIVLDAFMGSGTTLIAAEKTGRIAYGLELDPAYIDVAIRRYQAYTGKAATLAETGQTFAEVAAARGIPLPEGGNTSPSPAATADMVEVPLRGTPLPECGAAGSGTVPVTAADALAESGSPSAAATAARSVLLPGSGKGKTRSDTVPVATADAPAEPRQTLSVESAARRLPLSDGQASRVAAGVRTAAPAPEEAVP